MGILRSVPDYIANRTLYLPVVIVPDFVLLPGKIAKGFFFRVIKLRANFCPGERSLSATDSPAKAAPIDPIIISIGSVAGLRAIALTTGGELRIGLLPGDKTQRSLSPYQSVVIDELIVIYLIKELYHERLSLSRNSLIDSSSRLRSSVFIFRLLVRASQ